MPKCPTIHSIPWPCPIINKCKKHFIKVLKDVVIAMKIAGTRCSIDWQSQR